VIKTYVRLFSPFLVNIRHFDSYEMTKMMGYKPRADPKGQPGLAQQG
jgi:hypothetical protein